MNFLVKASDISKEIKESFPKARTSLVREYVKKSKIDTVKIDRSSLISKDDYFKIKNYYFEKLSEDLEVESIEIKYNKNSKFLNNWIECSKFATSMKLEFSTCVKYEIEFYLNEMQIRAIDLYEIAPKYVKNRLKKLNMV